MSHVHMPDADTLAVEFSIIVREWTTPHEWKLIDERNERESDPNICHSHDFIDANQAMADAFSVFGIDLEPNNEDHAKLVNAAWDLAKETGFYDEYDERLQERAWHSRTG